MDQMPRKSDEQLTEIRNRLLGSIKAELDAKNISAADLLALLAHTVGACIAMQDQRTMTPDQAMHIVATNIEAGNLEALDGLKFETRGPA